MPERSGEETRRAGDRFASSAATEAARPRPQGRPPTAPADPLVWFNVQEDSTVPVWSGNPNWQTVTKCHRAERGGDDLDEVDVDIEVFNQLNSRRARIAKDTYRNVGCVRSTGGKWIAVEYSWSIHYAD
jgi:hypothetical protein